MPKVSRKKEVINKDKGVVAKVKKKKAKSVNASVKKQPLKSKPKNKVLHKAVIWAGSIKELAKRTKITRAILQYSLHRQTESPVKVALAVEKATKGEINRTHFFPVLFKGYVKG